MKPATDIPEFCPECHCGDINAADEGAWASCNDCGHVFYDAETLALQREVRREQAQCKQILGHVPTYQEAVKLGLIKPIILAILLILTSRESFAANPSVKPELPEQVDARLGPACSGLAFSNTTFRQNPNGADSKTGGKGAAQTTAAAPFISSNRFVLPSYLVLTTLDAVATQRGFDSGRWHERNPLVPSSTGPRAAYFAGTTAAVIGTAYLFHKTGHTRISKVLLWTATAVEGHAAFRSWTGL